MINWGAVGVASVRRLHPRLVEPFSSDSKTDPLLTRAEISHPLPVVTIMMTRFAPL